MMVAGRVLLIAVSMIVTGSIGRSVYLSVYEQLNAEVRQDNMALQKVLEKFVNETISNTAESPCSDFFTYICGSDYEVNESQFRDFDEELGNRERQQLEEAISAEMIKQERKTGDTQETWLTKLKHFLSRCYERHDGITEKIRRLERYADGLPVQDRGDEKRFDFAEIAGRLYFETGESSIFGLFYGPSRDPRTGKVEIFFGLKSSDGVSALKIQKFLAGLSPELQQKLRLCESTHRDVMDLAMKVESVLKNSTNNSLNGNLYRGPENIHLDRFINFAIFGREKSRREHMDIRFYEISFRQVHAILEILDDADSTAVYKFIIANQASKAELKTLNIDCYDEASMRMGFAVTRVLADHLFKGVGLIDLKVMTDYIFAAFREYISEAPDLDPLSKQFMMNKLNAIDVHLGWPKWIMNDEALDGWFEMLQINKSMHYDVMHEELKRFQKRKACELGKPYGKVITFSWPLMVKNALYSPYSNRIEILGGLVHHLNYDPALPAAINFGAIGSVIGHEIAHAFDELSLPRSFNGKCLLKNGQTEECRFDNESSGMDERNMSDYQGFAAHLYIKNRGKCLGDSYRFCLGDHCSKDEKISREAQSDSLGGKMAFLGYQIWLATQGNRVDRVIHNYNYSDEKLFFMSYAQAWCGLRNKTEVIEHLINGQAHPQNPKRVLGSLQDMPQFEKAFSCCPGSPMAPKDRCNFWYQSHDDNLQPSAHQMSENRCDNGTASVNSAEKGSAATMDSTLGNGTVTELNITKSAVTSHENATTHVVDKESADTPTVKTNTSFSINLTSLMETLLRISEASNTTAFVRTFRKIMKPVIFSSKKHD